MCSAKVEKTALSIGIKNSHNFLWELLFKNVSQRDIQIFEESTDFRAMSTRVSFFVGNCGKIVGTFFATFKNTARIYVYGNHKIFSINLKLNLSPHALVDFVTRCFAPRPAKFL